MASDDELRALAKLTLRHKLLIEVVFGVCNDFASLIEPGLERCSHSSGCKTPATVNQVDFGVKMCDYHAAAAISRARANVLRDPGDDLALLRVRTGDDESWVDLPNAPQIRRLYEYVNELRKNDEPEPPADKAECH